MKRKCKENKGLAHKLIPTIMAEVFMQGPTKSKQLSEGRGRQVAAHRSSRRLCAVRWHGESLHCGIASTAIHGRENPGASHVTKRILDPAKSVSLTPA